MIDQKNIDMTRQCSTMFDNVRQCSTMFDNVRQCSTMFDNVRRVSTAELRCLDNTRHLIPSLFPNFITVISQYTFNIIKWIIKDRFEIGNSDYYWLFLTPSPSLPVNTNFKTSSVKIPQESFPELDLKFKIKPPPPKKSVILWLSYFVPIPNCQNDILAMILVKLYQSRKIFYSS